MTGPFDSYPAARPTPRADHVDGYAVPVDPMDDLQCESCQ